MPIPHLQASAQNMAQKAFMAVQQHHPEDIAHSLPSHQGDLWVWGILLVGAAVLLMAVFFPKNGEGWRKETNQALKWLAIVTVSFISLFSVGCMLSFMLSTADQLHLDPTWRGNCAEKYESRKKFDPAKNAMITERVPQEYCSKFEISIVYEKRDKTIDLDDPSMMGLQSQAPLSVPMLSTADYNALGQQQ